MKLLATVIGLWTLAGWGIADARPSACRIQLADGSPHSSIAQHFIDNLEREISASPHLALAESLNNFNVKFYLVGAPANSVADYPANDRFRVFYVLLGQDNTMDSAFILSCNGTGSSCAASAKRRLIEACGRMPNNSFKPTPLRGAA